MTCLRLLILPVLLGATGCASIVRGGAQDLSIVSVPPAQFEIHDNRSGSVRLAGTTPAVVKLDTGAGYFQGASYTVKLSSEGHVPQSFPIESSVNGWYAGGNLLIGGLIGYLIVDPATGAMWDLSPTQINAPLVALAPAPVPDAPAAAAPETGPAAEAGLELTSAPLTAPANPAGLARGSRGSVGQAAALRSRAIPDAQALAMLEPGAKVELIIPMQNAAGKWWYAQSGGRKGWLLESEISGTP